MSPNSSTVRINVELPYTDGISEDQYVHAALQQIARSYLDADRELLSAGCYGNWDYRVLHSPDPYRPTLWQVFTD